MSVDWSASGLRPLLSTSVKSPLVGALEGHAAVRGERLVAIVAAGEHHVDDGLEGRVEQDLERPIGRLPVLVGDLMRRLGALVTESEARVRLLVGPGVNLPWLWPDWRPAILSRSPVGPDTAAIPERSPREPARQSRKKLSQLRTFTPRPSDITRRWLVIDAEGAILGRMSTEIATLLRGKHKPIYAPHVDTGDHVIVINASKLAIYPEEGDRQAVPPPHRLPGWHPDRDASSTCSPATSSASCGSRCGACCRRARSAGRC